MIGMLQIPEKHLIVLKIKMQCQLELLQTTQKEVQKIYYLQLGQMNLNGLVIENLKSLRFP